MTCLNARSTGHNLQAGSRLNSFSLGTLTCSSKSSLNRFSSFMTLLTICLLLNMLLISSGRRTMATGIFFAVTFSLVIPVILSTSPPKDWKLRRLSVSALCPCFIAERSTEISKVILLKNGAEPNVLGLDLLPSTLLTGTTLFCFELYSVLASICTRFSVSPEHFAISSIVNLPSSKNFSAILSFSCSTAFACCSSI